MDSARLGSLIDRHAAALGLYARQWCDEPEDVVQEAFVSLAAERTQPHRDPEEVGPDLKLDGLFGKHTKGTEVAKGTEVGISDGSVRFLKETITPKLLKALLTKDGGEVIGSGEF